MAEKLYAQQPQGGEQAGQQQTQGEQASNENVVDAEYEEVKDDKKA